MIDNGTFKHNPDKSYSDKSISNSNYCNANDLNNSVVSELDYNDMMRDVQTRSQDCVNNNTPHPSEAACKNGFDKNNAINIEGNTANATPTLSDSKSNTTSSAGNSSIANPTEQNRGKKPDVAEQSFAQDNRVCGPKGDILEANAKGETTKMADNLSKAPELDISPAKDNGMNV